MAGSVPDWSGVVSDLSEQDLEDLELDDARRYGHISRVAEIEGRRWKRLKERAEKAEKTLERVRDVLAYSGPHWKNQYALADEIWKALANK